MIIEGMELYYVYGVGYRPIVYHSLHNVGFPVWFSGFKCRHFAHLFMYFACVLEKHST